MKNKKASIFFQESVIKTVLALIVLGFLFLGATDSYATFLGDYKERQAENLLKDIERNIKYLEENPDEDQISVLLSNPHDWHVVFNKQENLICVCPDSDFNKCNLRELCYFSGYKIRNLNQDSIKIELVEKGEKSFFKNLVISFEEKNKELRFLIKTEEIKEEIN